MERVLVIAAHPDDELLGLGGTIRRLANEGIECRALIMAEGLTSRADKRSNVTSSELEGLKSDARKAADIIGYRSIDFCELPDNRMDGIELLDIIKKISIYLEQYKPDTVFTHHHGDLNIDHRLTNEAVLTACRPVGEYCVKRIYTFETPSSTEWNYNESEPFKPNVFFDISESFEAKVRGMGCYETERTMFPHPRSTESLRALSRMRGSSVGFDMAEGFMLLRECI